jgi:hypothetical protein
MMTADIPPPEAKKKSVDRLALMVSVIALIVSGFSYWDSHQAARRDDERARPLLFPTSPAPFCGGTRLFRMARSF